MLKALATSLLALCLATPAAHAQAGRVASADSVRLKDLGRWQGWRENALIGYGIVTGLAGTGDSPGNRATRQALSNALSQFNLNIAADQVQSRNVAVVMVTASIPPFAREGDALDVSVSSAGDARSLVGGALLLTPLKAANGRTYALAQGALTVGGYRYDANGNVVQKNHPTVGAVPGGAVLEVGLVGAQRGAPSTRATFVLSTPDYITATRAATAINQQWGDGLARAVDASGIEIEVPEAERSQLPAFLARMEAVAVAPDQRARVVINERTGTLIAGGDVRISKVTVSHGELRVTVAAENQVSQPLVLGRASSAVRTEAVTNSRLDVDEHTPGGYLMASNTVADLVQSLARTKTHTRDVISILRAIKAAGALHADLIVQ
ncbi:MAG TPA: flagellar basal body P-ring protein FlgI [Anaerolineae bacterium]|nr:flagellar basal body P-ring protein FlgI [Anaerolineae bacterium]